MRIVARLAAVGSCGLLLTACTGGSTTDGHPGGHPDTPLRSALGRITATANTRGSVLFSSQAAAVQADDGSAVGPYMRAVDLGLGPLGPYDNDVSRVLGFAPDTAEYGIQAGSQPNAVTLVGGVGTGRVAAKLTALGATRSGDTYRLAPDHSVSPGSTLSRALPGLVGTDVARVSGSVVSFSSAAADLDLVTGSGGGSTLADDPAFSAAADCLGNPLGAVLSDRFPSAGKQVRLVGVGLSRGRGSTPRETMCVVTASDSAARAMQSQVRRAVSSGSSRQERRPWKQLLPGATVTRSGTTVELTAKSGASPGLLLVAVQSDDLPGLSG